MTNYEKIKAMSIEELAKVLDINAGICKNFPGCLVCIDSENDCIACTVRWLNDEVEDKANDVDDYYEDEDGNLPYLQLRHVLGEK